MTIQEAAQRALDVQDACNLSGVLHAFDKAIDAAWEEARRQGKGTDFVNRHSIVTVFLSKLVDLNGREAEFFKAYDEVQALAKTPAVVSA
jgi:hypothetical protein